MHTYVMRRLAETLLVVLGVSILTFIMVNLTPGDTAETIARHVFVGFDEVVVQEDVNAVSDMYSLDRPLALQYIDWLSSSLKGDLKESYMFNEPVIKMLELKLPNTIKLGGLALIISIIVGIPMGIISALNHNKLIDYLNRFLSLFLVSFPSFWLGLLLIIIFSLKLKIFPVSGMRGMKSIILPALTLSIGVIPVISQITRTSMLEIVNQDYMKIAKAKGVKPLGIILKHGLKNTLAPVLTVIGIQAGHIFAGSVVIESIFAWPGVGKLLIDSINAKDMPMLQGCVLVMAVSYTIINLLVDILYAYIDPRVHYGGK